MGDRCEDGGLGIDHQTLRGPVVALYLGQGAPPRHSPSPALKRRDLRALRARAAGRLTRATCRPEVAEWLEALPERDYHLLLRTVRVTPWLVYAALWWVADRLHAAAEDEQEPPVGQSSGWVHGVIVGGAAAGRSALEALGIHPR